MLSVRGPAFMEIDRSGHDVVDDPTSRDARRTTARRPRPQVPEDLDRGRPTPDLASAAAPGLSFSDGEALRTRLHVLHGDLEGTIRVLDGVVDRLRDDRLPALLATHVRDARRSS